MDATAWHRYFTAAVFKWVMTVRVACLIYLTCIFAWDWSTNSASYTRLIMKQSGTDQSVASAYSFLSGKIFLLLFVFFSPLILSPKPSVLIIYYMTTIVLTLYTSQCGHKLDQLVFTRDLSSRSGIIGMFSR